VCGVQFPWPKSLTPSPVVSRVAAWRLFGKMPERTQYAILALSKSGRETAKVAFIGRAAAVAPRCRVKSSSRREGSSKMNADSFNDSDLPRKQLAHAPTLNEALGAAIQGAAFNAILSIDERGVIQTINPATERMFGYPEDELIGQNVKLLMPPSYSEEHDGYLARYLATGEKRIIGMGREAIARRKGGSTFPVHLSVTEAFLGQERRFVGIIRDITERRQAEETRSRLAAIVQSSDDAIISKDLDGTIATWNQGAERLYGYNVREIVGSPISILIPDDRPDELAAIMERLKRGQRIEHFETVRVRKDGSRVEVSLTISPVKNEEGQIVRASKIARDITAQKRAEKDLRESNEKLQRALAELQAKSDELYAATQQLWQAAKLASVGELAAGIAHELNNPLATVSVRIESALARTPLDDPRRHSLEVIEQETKRMGNLVANLLNFSRRDEEQISTVDIRDELTRAVELIHYHLRKRQVIIVAEFAQKTPSVFADRQKLRQVFLNLLTNASDAMPRGGTLTLRCAPAMLDHERPAVRIEFVDTGAGIPAEQLPRVFDPFFTTKGEGHGTGLGLPICRRAVEEHHGTIQFLSELGTGTTVRIVLPVTSETNVDRLGESAAASASNVAGRSN
jgi:two-component system, LuxR family, sensor kinase FixL